MYKVPTYIQYDIDMKTRERSEMIPTLKFPTDWLVTILPPFGGATVRFRAEKGDKSISVYLDWDDNLGFVEQPYWELYPNAEGDCSRYLLNEHEAMMQKIDNLLSNK